MLSLRLTAIVRHHFNGDCEKLFLLEFACRLPD
jgi:hypothetical protein